MHPPSDNDTALPKALTTPPPPVPNVLITFPAPHVLLITLNRPAQLNALPVAQHPALAALYAWYDAEPWLRCAVLTGSGRAFCAGADLKEWNDVNTAAATTQTQQPRQGQQSWDQAGFGGLSNRTGKKPVIAAVNGLCLGGGMEMVVNCDIVIAAAGARFGLPEVGVGLIAVAGALPRLVRTVGKQRAAEMALLGRTGYTAATMEKWGVVNFVVDGDGDVVREAVKVASEMADKSPDAVIVSREGLRLGWEGVGPQLGTEILTAGWFGRMDQGENMREGVRSFVERRRPVWRDSKL
ncbi:ClpP/crotonase-like domain-containing protein [Cercophora scortea]|uniref:ClpP/crotonase-like domain-containing protein n=1 Tax=Cercophora scortea TaxID=314031 RepID=A0AAE0IG98_9PEZI|nr:ClpP/crotonase-like domain-containing protein [Cercophora scortea]